jgi:hypothetical protein
MRAVVVMLARLRSAASLANPGLTSLPLAASFATKIQERNRRPRHSTLNTAHTAASPSRAFTSPTANYKHSLDHTNQRYGVLHRHAAARRRRDAGAGAGLHGPGGHLEQQVKLDLHRRRA